MSTDADRNCKHADVRPGGYDGPRLPLQYGSAEIEICADCGMWHDKRDVGTGRRGWRAAAELLIAIARKDEE